MSPFKQFREIYRVEDFKVSDSYQKNLEILYLDEEVPTPVEEATGRVSFMKLAQFLSVSVTRNAAIIDKISEKYDAFEDFRCVVFSRFRQHNKCLYELCVKCPNKYIIDGTNTKTNT